MDSQTAMQADDDQEEYEVESILRHRKNRTEFLVKWKGWTDPTWEPLDYIDDTLAYDNYLKQLPTTADRTRRKGPSRSDAAAHENDQDDAFQQVVRPPKRKRYRPKDSGTGRKAAAPAARGRRATKPDPQWCSAGACAWRSAPGKGLHPTLKEWQLPLCREHIDAVADSSEEVCVWCAGHRTGMPNEPNVMVELAGEDPLRVLSCSVCKGVWCEACINGSIGAAYFEGHFEGPGNEWVCFKCDASARDKMLEKLIELGVQRRALRRRTQAEAAPSEVGEPEVLDVVEEEEAHGRPDDSDDDDLTPVDDDEEDGGGGDESASSEMDLEAESDDEDSQSSYADVHRERGRITNLIKPGWEGVLSGQEGLVLPPQADEQPKLSWLTPLPQHVEVQQDEAQGRSSFVRVVIAAKRDGEAREESLRRFGTCVDAPAGTAACHVGGGIVRSVAWLTADSKQTIQTLAVACEDSVQLWHVGVEANAYDERVPTAEAWLVLLHDGGAASDLCWCPSGNSSCSPGGLDRLGLLAAACDDAKIRLWALPTYASLCGLAEGGALPITAWVRPNIILERPGVQPLRLAWRPAPKCSHLAVGGADGSLVVWDLNSARHRAHVEGGRAAGLISLSQPAIIFGKAPLEHVEARSSKEVRIAAVHSVRWAPRTPGLLAAGRTDGCIQVWNADVDCWVPTHSLRIHPGWITAVEWSRFKPALIVGIDEGHLYQQSLLKLNPTASQQRCTKPPAPFQISEAVDGTIALTMTGDGGSIIVITGSGRALLVTEKKDSPKVTTLMSVPRQGSIDDVIINVDDMARPPSAEGLPPLAPQSLHCASLNPNSDADQLLACGTALGVVCLQLLRDRE